MSACNDRNDNIYFNKSFEETCTIASRKGKSFCITLIDSTKELSQKYCSYMKNERLITNQAIYNIIDVNLPSNEWYIKWICPLSLPLTCVFSSKGELIDLIPGSTKETFLYIKEVVFNKEMTKFHYPNRFHLDKSEIIPLLNQMLKSKIELSQGIYESIILNNALDSLKYPYPYFLKIAGGILENDTIMLKLIAKSMLELENPYYLKLFKDEFIVAKKILNPNFNINDEPNIRVNKHVISFPNCKKNKKYPFEISIYNDGNQPLEVTKIFKSCSCLNQIDHLGKFVINPKDSIVVKFNFESKEQGEIIRDIFITSNAINVPILYVQVLANIY